MSQLSINSELSTLVDSFKSELRALILKAGAEVNAADEVVLKIEDDVEAVVNAAKASITVSGQGVSELSHLISIAKALAHRAGSGIENVVKKIEDHFVPLTTKPMVPAPATSTDSK